MTKKEEYRNAEAIAIYGLTNTAAIEILNIDDETVYYCLNSGERGTICKSKLYYNNDGSTYFINRLFEDQSRIRLDECMRTNL